MLQISHPLQLTADLSCGVGHRPQLVECRGAPQKHVVGGPCPILWHVECSLCGSATVPHPSKAIAELRWSDPSSPHRIPLSLIGQARQRVFCAFPVAA